MLAAISSLPSRAPRFLALTSRERESFSSASLHTESSRCANCSSRNWNNRVRSPGVPTAPMAEALVSSAASTSFAPRRALSSSRPTSLAKARFNSGRLNSPMISTSRRPSEAADQITRVLTRFGHQGPHARRRYAPVDHGAQLVVPRRIECSERRADANRRIDQHG